MTIEGRNGFNFLLRAPHFAPVLRLRRLLLNPSGFGVLVQASAGVLDAPTIQKTFTKFFSAYLRVHHRRRLGRNEHVLETLPTMAYYFLGFYRLVASHSYIHTNKSYLFFSFAITQTSLYLLF